MWLIVSKNEVFKLILYGQSLIVVTNIHATQHV